MKTTVKILTDARALIADENDWWPGLERGGPPTLGKNCALHALGRISARIPIDFSRGDAYNVLFKLSGNSVAAFNDTHTHAEVLALFDRAIKVAQEAA